MRLCSAGSSLLSLSTYAMQIPVRDPLPQHDPSVSAAPAVGGTIFAIAEFDPDWEATTGAKARYLFGHLTRS
jgi:hypothetical protein